jgi:hypothetical protein
MNDYTRKYEFTNEAAADAAIAALPHDEEGNPSHGHNVVKLGYLTIEPAVYDEDGNETKAAVVSDVYAVDVWWFGEPLASWERTSYGLRRWVFITLVHHHRVMNMQQPTANYFQIARIVIHTRTDAQKESLNKLIAELLIEYSEASVHGHNEFSAKACPSFDVQKEFAVRTMKKKKKTDVDSKSKERSDA